MSRMNISVGRETIATPAKQAMRPADVNGVGVADSIYPTGLGPLVGTALQPNARLELCDIEHTKGNRNWARQVAAQASA